MTKTEIQELRKSLREKRKENDKLQSGTSNTYMLDNAFRFLHYLDYQGNKFN